MVGNETFTKCNWLWKYDPSLLLKYIVVNPKPEKEKKNSLLRYDYLNISPEEKYKYYKTENANFEEGTSGTNCL